jgi:hypothetical protein
MVSRIAKGAAILVEEYEPFAAEPDQPLGKLKSSLEKNGDVVTPKRLLDVPDVLEIQLTPSTEVRIVPFLPTAMKMLFPYVTPWRSFDVAVVLEVHVIPLSKEVLIVPPPPTTTKRKLS